MIHFNPLPGGVSVRRLGRFLGLSILVVLFSLICAAPLGAQLTGKGSTSGTVTGGTGAVIPNATVTATNGATGISATTTSTGAGRAQLIAILQREAEAVAEYQDGVTGLWYQVMDKAGAQGDYLESSAACMFVYALAKGVHRGYLPAHYMANAERGYSGILARFVKTGPGADVSLTDTVKSAGLDGDPYRDGTYAHYVGENTATNDTKGVGSEDYDAQDGAQYGWHRSELVEERDHHSVLDSHGR